MQQAEQSLLGGSRHRLRAGPTAAAPNRYALPAAPNAAPTTGAGAGGWGARGTAIPAQQSAATHGAAAYAGAAGLNRGHSSSLHTTLPYSAANSYGAAGGPGSYANGAGGYGDSGASYLSADYTQRHAANTARSASGRYM